MATARGNDNQRSKTYGRGRGRKFDHAPALVRFRHQHRRFSRGVTQDLLGRRPEAIEDGLRPRPAAFRGLENGPAPTAEGSAAGGRPVKTAAAVHHQAPRRITPVGAVEGTQRDQRTAGRQFKHGAHSSGAA